MNKKGSGVKVLIGIIVFIGLIIFSSSFVVTEENEFTLIKRFSKVSNVIDSAGINFKIPFIETADKLPKEILFYDLPASDVITQDKKTMVADCYVLWKITDPLKFAQTLNNSITSATNRINNVVYNSIKAIISSMPQAEVISGRAGVLSERIMKNIGETMEQYGVKLITVETKHLDLPSDNKTAVYERMISERDKIASQYKAEGESNAKITRNETDKNIAIRISNAKTEAAKIVAEGEAEYMKILSDAYSDTDRAEFYTFIRSLEAAKTSLKNGDNTLILSNDSPIAQIFYNLD